MWHWIWPLSNVWIGGSRVPRISLLLILLVLQVPFHELSDCWWVAPWIVLIRISVLADAKHGWWLRLRMTFSYPLAVLHMIILLSMATVKGHLLEVEIVGAFSRGAFWKLVAVVIWSSVGLVRLVLHLLLGSHLLTILLIRWVLEIFSSKRQYHFFSTLGCPLANSLATQSFVRARVEIL